MNIHENEKQSQRIQQADLIDTDILNMCCEFFLSWKIELKTRLASELFRHILPFMCTFVESALERTWLETGQHIKRSHFFIHEMKVLGKSSQPFNW